jgi:hypothetical protein
MDGVVQKKIKDEKCESDFPMEHRPAPAAAMEPGSATNTEVEVVTVSSD